MNSDLYQIASSHMEKSWQAWEEGAHFKSWGHTLPARIAYLCEMVVSAIKLPFAIIAITFASLIACITCGWKSERFQGAYTHISKVSNHLFLSAFGAFISPAISHKYRDANITPFIIAARIVVISGGLLYALLHRG